MCVVKVGWGWGWGAGEEFHGSSLVQVRAQTLKGLPDYCFEGSVSRVGTDIADIIAHATTTNTESTD